MYNQEWQANIKMIVITQMNKFTGISTVVNALPQKLRLYFMTFHSKHYEKPSIINLF